MDDLEVEMIRTARRLDLLTCPYVFNVNEAVKMADAGAKMCRSPYGHHLLGGQHRRAQRNELAGCRAADSGHARRRRGYYSGHLSSSVTADRLPSQRTRVSSTSTQKEFMVSGVPPASNAWPPNAPSPNRPGPSSSFHCASRMFQERQMNKIGGKLICRTEHTGNAGI